MNMSSENLLVILFVGLVAGWLAGQIMRGPGFGIIGDLIVGILGAFIGSWLLPQLGIHLGTGVITAIINATIGAILLLLVVSTLSRWQRMGKQVERRLGTALVTIGDRESAMLPPNAERHRAHIPTILDGYRAPSLFSLPGANDAGTRFTGANRFRTPIVRMPQVRSR
jgi:uncharacterized membrane protein YeaQ/YmgE (transglycosylase-associated protein family)